MKLPRVCLIIILLAGVGLTVQIPSASAVCLNMSGHEQGADILQGPYHMPAGSWVTITLNSIPGGGTRIVWAKHGVTAGDSIAYTSPHTVTITFAEDTDGFWFFFEWEYGGHPENTFRVLSSECITSCDALIPAQAVVGQFHENSELYWTPGAMIQPMQYIEAGKTYYVAGLDASGGYYKVLVSCDWVWVRASTVGPNYDEVWNGAPLPTEIVN